ncbi:MAG: tetrahydromethanopterin S-methyltransferase subunit G, partial [Halobacteriota archaeon]
GRDTSDVVGSTRRVPRVAQRYGQRVDRDIGIASGLIGGVILFIVLNTLTQVGLV